jgi:hypothetical protein
MHQHRRPSKDGWSTKVYPGVRVDVHQQSSGSAASPLIVAAIIMILGGGSPGPALASMHRSQAPSAHRTGQAELSCDLRRLDASLEGGAHGVQLSRRQMNGNRLDPLLVPRFN